MRTIFSNLRLLLKPFFNPNMRKVAIFLCLMLWSFLLYGQDDKTIIVKKGTTLQEYVEPSERYLYPEFKTGKVLFKTNAYMGIKLNYHYLNAEIEFLKTPDTLIIADKRDLMSIIIAEDTFYYDNGYILLINSGNLKIGLKESIEFKDYIKKDGIGSTSSAGSSTSYSSVSTGSGLHKLTADADLIFRRTKTFYIMTTKGDFDLYNKKNICKMFPKDKDKIKSYLKSNNIKFDSQEDLLKLTDFLETL